VLVGDVADDLLEDVLEGDQALERAVFVDDEGEMRPPADELAHLVVERRRLGDEVGLHGDRHDVEARERLHAAGDLAQAGGDGAGEVLGVDDADDVLGVAAIDRQPGVRRGERLGEDLLGRRVAVDRLDVAAVHHHLLDLALAEVERAEQAVAVGLLHPALGMVQRDRAGDLLLGGEERWRRVGGDAEEPQDEANQHPHGVDDRREQGGDEADRRATKRAIGWRRW
jgi:hypothetical protein